MGNDGRIRNSGLGTESRNQELLNTIFRGFHTIKGTSAFVNLDCVKDIAHQWNPCWPKSEMENMFHEKLCQSGSQITDVIKSILEQMKSSGPGQQIELPRGYQGLLESLRNFVPDSRCRKWRFRRGINGRTRSGGSGLYENEQRENSKKGRASSEQSASSNKIREQMTESTVRVKVDRLDKLLDTVVNWSLPRPW
jgi:two-component system chemotaxis sensor kinase CheA